MLKNTFCHAPGIGLKTEEKLWEAGITDWETGLRMELPEQLVVNRSVFRKFITDSLDYLEAEDISFFKKKLPGHLAWRAFPEFRHSTAYIDIETTGLSPLYSEITTIALYDGSRVKYYIQGINLEDFHDDIFQYQVIVTYNGKAFDVPFIDHVFGTRLDHFHIDLRFILKRLGLRGGLKRCEQQIGISRNELEGVDGRFAIFLWDDYQRKGNKKALETLLAYNIEDVVNLEKLLIYAYNQHAGNSPFADALTLGEPAAVEVDQKPDMETILRLRSRYY